MCVECSFPSDSPSPPAGPPGQAPYATLRGQIVVRQRVAEPCELNPRILRILIRIPISRAHRHTPRTQRHTQEERVLECINDTRASKPHRLYFCLYYCLYYRVHHRHTRIHTTGHGHMHIHSYIRVCVCVVCVCACTVCVYMYIYIYIEREREGACMYVFTYVCVYIYIYPHRTRSQGRVHIKHGVQRAGGAAEAASWLVGC